jgi:hypothetical protein
LGVTTGRWYLPPAVFSRDGRRAEAAQWQPMRLRPATDRPALGGALGPTMPPPYLIPAGPLTYAASPDVQRLTPPWRWVTAEPDRPDTSRDPATEASRRRLLATPAELRKKPAPLLRVTIPNPLEQIVELRLTKPRPDVDPPARDCSAPPKIALPVLPSEPKK